MVPSGYRPHLDMGPLSWYGPYLGMVPLSWYGPRGNAPAAPPSRRPWQG